MNVPASGPASCVMFMRKMLMRLFLPRRGTIRPPYAVTPSGVKETPMTFSRRVSAVNA
ncbi:MAG: hypothetical protein QOG68_2476 [Solirubrobacteraceae bacterium]|jgi:hypothetical protein|nr:hypothetical protein [Solirubrobacteraceae bacterium]